MAELPAYPSLEPIMRGTVLFNLAIAYYYRHAASVARAIPYYQRAADDFRREGLNDALATCLQNLAWAHCGLDQAEQASQVLDQAAPLCTCEAERLRQGLTNALVGLATHASYPDALQSAHKMATMALSAATNHGSRCFTTANRVYKRIGAVLLEQSRGA